MREAWRSDPMSEDTETAALDQFGALFTAGDHKARMDTMLYSTEQEAAGLRAAKRLGVRAISRWPRRGIAANEEGLQSAGRCSRRCRANCMATPAISSPRSSCSAARRNSPKPRN